MKKGFIDIVRYYSTGIGLIYIMYAIFGQSNIESLAPYHYAIILMYFFSILWLLKTMHNYFLRNKKTSYRKTVMLVNFIILFGFTLWMYFLTSK